MFKAATHTVQISSNTTYFESLNQFPTETVKQQTLSVATSKK